MKMNSLPLTGVLISLACFGLAAWRYPGGYDWAHDFVSTLFAPTTANRAVNGARPIAVLAMFVLCFSLAVLFKQISGRAGRKVQAKTLEIGGIGSMVYGFLVVTPLHDLLVGVGLVFFLAAMGAALHWLGGEGRSVLFWSGILCLGLLVASAIMYYGHLFWHLLPLAQKASFVACVAWLLTIHHVTGKARRVGTDQIVM